MEKSGEFLALIHKRARQRILFLPHAVHQMSRPDRMISTSAVRHVIEKGEIIEDYPENTRGHSCLMLGEGTGGRPVHVVCSPKDGYLAVITAYIPSQEEWTDNFRKRTRS